MIGALRHWSKQPEKYAVLILVAIFGVVGCGGGAGGYSPPTYTFSVAGRITDATSSSPISGATVTVSAGSSVLGTVTTNASGDYSISNLSTSSTSATWVVAAATYRSFSTALTISGGGTYTVNYAMARQVGSVSGSLSVSVASLSPPPRSGDVQVFPGLNREPPGAPQFVPDEVLVKLKRGVSTQAAAGLHRSMGAQVVASFDRLGVSVLRITSGDSVSSVLSRYRTDSNVEFAEPNYYRYLSAQPSATPNDTYYSLQWHYPNISLPSAWDTTRGSSLVIVAVIDTGILSSHPDLQGVTVQGFDFFDSDSNPADPGCPVSSDLSHGSHVAGTIAALTNNSSGVAGVNWGGASGTKIMPLRIFGNISGLCTTTSSRVIQAITYAADHGAKVINMSFGGGATSSAEEAAVNDAFSRGVVLVASAMNSNTSTPSYPAAYTNVIAVGAVDLQNNRAPYSNYGSWISVVAPGGDTTVDRNGDGYTDGVLSTSGTAASPNQYLFFQGTSMAAPHVSGVAALMIANGITGPSSIRTILQNTATDLGSPGRDNTFGYGLVNAAAALGASATRRPMKAFSGDISGTTITARSDMVNVGADGSFSITNAHAGTRTAFAWQDFNGDGIVNTGDYFGSVSGVVINDNATTSSVTLTVAVRTTSQSPITVTSVLSVQKH